MFKERRKKLDKLLANKEYDLVLIDSPWNLYYYTGFTGGEAMLVMPIGFDNPDGIIRLITDSRYYEQVEKECPDVELIRLDNTTYVKAIEELLRKLYGVGNRAEKKIVIEGTMNLSRYLKIKEVCDKDILVVDSETINECRMVKDEGELQLIKRAEAIGDEAFTHILDILKPGISEKEISLELEYYMKNQGASKLSFDTIVASGSNSSMPHAQVTDKKIQSGDFVTMDFGCVYKGYCSDMTRTVAVGQPNDEMKKIYKIVLDANLRAMDGIRAGVRCCDIDALARDYIKENGYGEYFGHGLGHSVGLEIHEEPRFSPKCDVVTKAGMVITDEPGIYIPGRFGVRIEDLCVVKEDGYEQLSNSPKELIIL